MSDLEVTGLDEPNGGVATKFNRWTSSSDAQHRLFFPRPYDSYNDICFDLSALAGESKRLVLPSSGPVGCRRRDIGAEGGAKTMVVTDYGLRHQGFAAHPILGGTAVRRIALLAPLLLGP
jgi:hypothetical protein